MAKINPILLLGVIGGAAYLYTSSTKKTSTALPTPKSGDKGKGGQDEITQGYWFVEYDCKSIEIFNRPAFNKEISTLINTILKEEKITPQNLFKLDAVTLAKKAVAKFSTKCANRNPKDMTLDEKIIFFFIAASIISEFRRLITIDYDPNVGYEEIITEDCPPMEAPFDWSKCKYVWDVKSPTYKQWLIVLKEYKHEIIEYLGLENNEKELLVAWNKLKVSNKYP